MAGATPADTAFWMMIVCEAVDGTERAAIAIETTQPIRLQPKKKLMTITDPKFGTRRIEPMMDGMKYRKSNTRTAKPFICLPLFDSFMSRIVNSHNVL